jgi:hypothetical protein
VHDDADADVALVDPDVLSWEPCYDVTSQALPHSGARRPHNALTWTVNAGLILTIVASLLATICESVPHLARRYSLCFQLVQLTVATIFCLEYLMRVWTAERHQKREYFHYMPPDTAAAETRIESTGIASSLF